MAEGIVVKCGECGIVLAEEPNASPRFPCPACGSADRSVAVNVGSVSLTASVPVPSQTVELPLLDASPKIFPPEIRHAKEVLASLTPTLIFVPPTEDGEPWYCAIEAEGELIPLGLAADFDAALLEAAEVLSERYGQSG